MGLLNIIRRMHLRQKLSVREIARRTGLSRNTVSKHLAADTVEPKFATPERPSKLDPFAEKLAGWLKTNAGKPRKERQTLKKMHADLVTLGFTGSYNRVAAFARDWRADRQREQHTTGRGTFVPLAFRPGEAFQFDWSEDFAVVGGERTKLQVAHIKLSHSRAFLLRAYSLEFAKVAYRIDDAQPLASLKAALARMPASYAFPTDEEFVRALTEGDLYHKRVCFHVLDALENRDRNEQVDTTGFSIEHVMPQNRNLHESWRQMLGGNWQEIQKTWLHRLGNLTLTGYNATYSDRPFEEKMTIPNGFNETPIRLSRNLRDLVAWTEEEMRKRGEDLAARALGIWPALNADTAVIRAMAREELKARAAQRPLSTVTMGPNARTLFDALRDRIRAAFPEVIEMPETKSVSYHDPEFFAELIPRANGLSVLIGIDYSEVDGPDETVRDTANYSFVTNASYQGGVLINLRGQDQVEQAMRVIMQAHTLAYGA